MHKINIKTKKEVETMREGGKRLAEVKHELERNVKPGVLASEIEELACKLIKKREGEASFKMVPGYSWATCVNVNEGVVHGVPKETVEFVENDVVSVDVGFYYKGFHTDTSLSVYLGSDPKIQTFLEKGKNALKSAISEVKKGKKIGDISKKMGETVKEAGYTPVKTLTGHGIGRNLHEDPRVPCTFLNSRDEEVEIVEGMVLALEVMYTMGSDELVLDDDGWTLSTKDGKMAALFEETVVTGDHGPIVLTN